MVSAGGERLVAAAFLFGQLIERLPPITRARLLMTLLGLILLGLLMILCIMLGARYVRRLSRLGLGPTKPGDDNWHRRPLSPPADPRDDSRI